jgi:N-acetyl-gamma-glutamyl-phosphate reductase
MSAHWPVIILGGSGYVAGEMLRLVLGHPALGLAASVSTSQAGEPIGASFPHLAPVLGDARFASIGEAEALVGSAEQSILLSAAPHGESAGLIGQMLDRAKAAGTRLTVVDASADFRFADPAAFQAIYGKPHPRPELSGRQTSICRSTGFHGIGA